MATLEELDGTGHIHKWEVDLPVGGQYDRFLYASPRLMTWLQDILPTLETTLGLEVTPMQQIDALAESFVTGQTLRFRREFKPLVNVGDGIWELRTPDIRLIGWFPHFDHFLGFCADDAWHIKEYRLYAPYGREAVNFRGALPLTEPKFIPGDDPGDVVSAFD
jgi:hypothetical protein